MTEKLAVVRGFFLSILILLAFTKNFSDVSEVIVSLTSLNIKIILFCLDENGGKSSVDFIKFFQILTGQNT